MSESVADQNDEREALESSVAELLSSLSEQVDAPTEFSAPGTALDPSDIKFESGEWMAAVAAVQGWLHLDEPLRLDDPRSFVLSIAGSLGIDPPEQAFDNESTATVSDVFLEHLRDRADQASKFQQVFIEALEVDGGTVATATGAWVEAWTEQPEVEQTAGPVSARADTWPIFEFSQRAERGRLELSPSYQRGDVWPTSDSQILIESILRGIPLPSVIILRPEDRPLEIVDGKQRLTAILRFIGQHPRALQVVQEATEKYDDARLEKTFKTDYPAFRHLWKNHTGEQLTSSQEREHYFPFRLRSSAPAFVGELEPLAGKYYTQIKNITVQIADERFEIADVFERTTSYRIPVIEYTKANRRQIHEVFNLYNKQGKHLNAEEIRNALYHEFDLMPGLLVAAGDNPDVDAVAPFLAPIWDELRHLQATLLDYGFGTSRYRRTKVLSWLASLLFVDSMDANGRARKLSTSRQIDFLLQRIADDTGDPLRRHDAIRDAFSLMNTGIEAHAAVDDAWSGGIKGSPGGSKWQEVPLVATVLGVTLAATVLGSDTEDRLFEKREVLAQKTATKLWHRPLKTQTATQWTYIGNIALRILAELDVDPDEVSDKLVDRFGFSCIATLRAVSDDER